MIPAGCSQLTLRDTVTTNASPRWMSGQFAAESGCAGRYTWLPSVMLTRERPIPRAISVTVQSLGPAQETQLNPLRSSARPRTGTAGRSHSTANDPAIRKTVGSVWFDVVHCPVVFGQLGRGHTIAPLIGIPGVDDQNLGNGRKQLPQGGWRSNPADEIVSWLQSSCHRRRRVDDRSRVCADVRRCDQAEQHSSEQKREDVPRCVTEAWARHAGPPPWDGVRRHQFPFRQQLLTPIFARRIADSVLSPSI